MGGKTDIGAHFERLTRRGSGGRRLGNDVSVKDRIRDVLAKGRDVATRTTGRGDAGAAPTDAVVTIEYSPRMDGDPDPGDVVWVWVPYEEDPTQGKDRPVVVIGRRGGALVGIPLTTKQDDREAQVSVGAGDWDPQGRVSYARIWRLIEVDPTEMRREGAVLARDRFDRVIDAVGRHYDVRSASGAMPATGPSGQNVTGDDS